MMNFEQWNHCLRSNCGHYYGEPGKAHAQTDGIFRMQDRHGVDVADIQCSIDRIERTSTGIRRDEAEHIFLLFQKNGTTQVTHNGRQEVLAPGEGILLDSTAPAELLFEGRPSAFLSAHLPRTTCLEGQSRTLSAGRKIGVDHPLSASFQALLAPATDIDDGQYSPRFLSELTALAFGETGPITDAARISERRHRYRFVTSVIDRNLTDPTLTLDWLATQVHMSRRQLQREFRGHGTSFSAYVQRQRLKFVAENLRQAARLQLRPPISDLAFRSGFGDISHFNRAFRQRYGTAPRDFLKETGRRLRAH